MHTSIDQALLAFRTRYLGPPMRQLRTAWKWWIAELYPLLPEKLRRIVGSGNQRLSITAVGDEFVVQHGNDGKIREIGRIPHTAGDTAAFPVPDNIRETVLLLAQDEVLTCAMTLPLAAEENLREVLSFEMDRQTPFSVDDVYYDFVVTGRSSAGKTLSLLLFVSPRHTVNESLALLIAAGIAPDTVTLHAPDNPDGHAINLVPADQRSKRRAVVHRLNVSLATLALVLVVTAIALPIWQKDRTIDSLQAKVQAATAAAQTGNQLMHEVEKLVDGSNYLVRKKRAELTVLQMLDEMTRVIPDNTWTNRIEMNGGEIQLQGQSGSAARLIALIEASSMFHNVRFRSPVTQVVRTNQERFHLSAEVSPVQDE